MTEVYEGSDHLPCSMQNCQARTGAADRVVADGLQDFQVCAGRDDALLPAANATAVTTRLQCGC